MTLNEIVNRLAHDHLEHIRVTDPATGIPELKAWPRRPLLVDLIEAGKASIGRRSGSSVGPRVLIDGDAIDLQEQIRGDLVQDLIRIGAPIKVLPLHEFTAYWLTEWRLTDPTLAEETAWVETFHTWETLIRELVEPNKTLHCLGTPCPICGHTRYDDPAAGTSEANLTIKFHEDQPESTLALVCKRCGIIAQGSKAAAAVLQISDTA